MIVAVRCLRDRSVLFSPPPVPKLGKSPARLASRSSSFRLCGKAKRSRVSSLGVQSRHLMDWVDDESIRLRSPLFADEFIGREAFEGLQPTAKIVCVDEVLKVPSELVVIVIMEPLDGRLLDGSVHALDLPIGPCAAPAGDALHRREGMVDLCQPVLDLILIADPIEDVMERIFVASMICELNAVARREEALFAGYGHARRPIQRSGWS